jgi:S-adenosylmethionine:tRNA ribosyltransferase-isomerase
MDIGKKLMDIGEIRIADYNYLLPDDRIARFPAELRDRSKLLVYRAKSISEDSFFNLSDHIDEKSLMVFNNTRVIHARLEFRQETGSRIEVLCLEPSLPAGYPEMFQRKNDCEWLCMVGNLKKWKKGALQLRFFTGGTETILTAEKLQNSESTTLVRFVWDNDMTFGELIESAGIIPLPPYIDRKAIPEDKIRYQTVYSIIEGSVAAPTAGLHFTEAVFDSLKKKDIDKVFITLHVGAGTFKPIKSETIYDHEMHNEHFMIYSSDLEKIINKKGMLIAVGTTSVRTLESLYWLGVKTLGDPDIKPQDLVLDQWESYRNKGDVQGEVALESLCKWMKQNHLSVLNSSTRIIIIPGYKFRLVEAIITNFHQPGSTLLLLVSAWAGDDWKKIYRYAMDNDFRFLSYGDSSILYK